MKLRKAASFAQLIACIGVIPGFMGVFYNMEQQRIENEQMGKAMRLTALGAVNDMIEKDHAQQANIEKALNYIKKFPEGNLDELPEGKTGRQLYYETPGLSEAGRHYEHLGAMVKLGYIDFDLIFEVISFPDKFWDSSEPLMNMIRQNWGGKGQPLPDLWINFRFLREKYHQQRALNKEQASPDKKATSKGVIKKIRDKL